MNDKLDVEWFCPTCGAQNIDSYRDTARPLCWSCEEDRAWEDILDEGFQEQLNEIWQAEEA
jgi:hypothetical protein